MILPLNINNIPGSFAASCQQKLSLCPPHVWKLDENKAAMVQSKGAGQSEVCFSQT